MAAAKTPGTKASNTTWRPGACDGKGIPVRCWTPGDVVVGSGTVKRVSKGRWDAREQTEMVTVTWSNGAKSYLPHFRRRHLERCVHGPKTETQA